MPRRETPAHLSDEAAYSISPLQEVWPEQMLVGFMLLAPLNKEGGRTTEHVDVAKHPQRVRNPDHDVSLRQNDELVAGRPVDLSSPEPTRFRQREKHACVV